MGLLKIEKLCIEFPSRHGSSLAVDNVSFELKSGEILGLVGESGAGKSTIGNGIIDLLSPPGFVSSGKILLNNENIAHYSNEKIRSIRGNKIGFIFQDPMTSLNPLLTIETQLVETIITHLSLTRSQAVKKSIELLQSVGIPQPEIRIKQYPHQFSGGMRQRVVIAIALSCDPEIIIADEPTTALDVSVQNQILQLIRQLCKKHQVGCILVTHDMGVIANTADRVAVMYKGKLVEIGLTSDVLGNPNHPYTKSLMSAVPRGDVKLDRFPEANYIEKNHQHRIDVSTHWLGQKEHFDQYEGINLLEVKQVNLKFLIQSAFFEKNRRYVQASNNVSFSVREGETFGLVGESGSGKSTIARVVSGLYVPDDGKVLFANKNISEMYQEKNVDHKKIRRQIQMIFQNPYSSLNPRMSIKDIIAEPIRFHQLAESETQINDIVLSLLDHVGLPRQSEVKYPHAFSGGQRQRISIARALATRPRLLICDEPTSALDVSVQAQILNLLKDLQDELGLTLLFISHDLPVVRQMCDRVAVMKLGSIVEVNDTENLFTQPVHEYSKTLINLMPSMHKILKKQLVV